MNIAPFHIQGPVVGALLATSVAAMTDDEANAMLDAWNENGARIFSDVCMASAPGFATLKDRALKAGFKDVNGRLLHDTPAAEVSLYDNDYTCGCRMIMGAPEFPNLLVGIVDQLEADYPDASRDDPTPGGKGYSAIFNREGADVRLVLNPETFKETQMLAGFVLAEGACPQ
ncbi:MAG: hypothetical protein AB8B82_06275 [Roseovarius sp.]